MRFIKSQQKRSSKFQLVSSLTQGSLSWNLPWVAVCFWQIFYLLTWVFFGCLYGQHHPGGRPLQNQPSSQLSARRPVDKMTRQTSISSETQRLWPLSCGSSTASIMHPLLPSSSWLFFINFFESLVVRTSPKKSKKFQILIDFSLCWFV